MRVLKTKKAIFCAGICTVIPLLGFTSMNVLAAQNIVGDINNDDLVNVLDYNLLISCMQKDKAMCTSSIASLADLNHDGIVNGVDYNILLKSIIDNANQAHINFVLPKTWIIHQAPTPAQSNGSSLAPEKSSILSASDKATSITISRYSANSFTTPKDWYQNRQSTATSKDPAGTVYADTTFLNQPAYCVTPQGATTTITPPTGIPWQLYSGTCYIVWKNKVYAMKVVVQNSSNYAKNLSDTNKILNGIIFE